MIHFMFSPSKDRSNRRRLCRLTRIGTDRVALAFFVLMALSCFVTLPWSIQRYDMQRLDGDMAMAAPSLFEPMGTDLLGRSVLWRALLGGAISLSIGVTGAGLAVFLGVVWGATAGYVGGRTDTVMMRIVDVLYGLPYILLVVLLDMAIQPQIESLAQQSKLPTHVAAAVAQVVTLLVAIGGVSWLTMARVVRGQVLRLSQQPFAEAARACGAGPVWVLRHHMLPNLTDVIIVYGLLTVPTAILQESFLSFLGIGVQAPLPSWGNLAAQGLNQLHALGQTGIRARWWLLAWPCTLLGATLLCLNRLGDQLRNRLNPKHAA